MGIFARASGDARDAMGPAASPTLPSRSVSSWPQLAGCAAVVAMDVVHVGSVRTRPGPRSSLRDRCRSRTRCRYRIGEEARHRRRQRVRLRRRRGGDPFVIVVDVGVDVDLLFRIDIRLAEKTLGLAPVERFAAGGTGVATLFGSRTHFITHLPSLADASMNDLSSFR